MNQQERDQMRAKHARHETMNDPYCKACNGVDWPCDVIVALDDADQKFKVIEVMGTRLPFYKVVEIFKHYGEAMR